MKDVISDKRAELMSREEDNNMLNVSFQNVIRPIGSRADGAERFSLEAPEV